MYPFLQEQVLFIELYIYVKLLQVAFYTQNPVEFKIYPVLQAQSLLFELYI